jgi:hypothetical protein
VERHALLFVRHLDGIFVLGSAHGLAEHFHVTTKGEKTNLPPSTALRGPAEDFGPKTNGEDFHADTIEAGHRVMTELMKENDYGEDKQERDAVGPD